MNNLFKIYPKNIIKINSIRKFIPQYYNINCNVNQKYLKSNINNSQYIKANIFKYSTVDTYNNNKSNLQAINSNDNSNIVKNTNYPMDKSFLSKLNEISNFDISLYKKTNYNWAKYYYSTTNEIRLPVISLITNNIEDYVILPHSIFNTPVRPDIIYKVYQFNKNYNAETSKWTKDKGMVAGSGKKPFKQKGLGRARQGNKRAPHIKGGGHVFPLKPKKLFYPLNKKIRLYGLKSILTSKLIQNQIIIIDKIETNEVIECYDKLVNDNSVDIESLSDVVQETKLDIIKHKYLENFKDDKDIDSLKEMNKAIIYNKIKLSVNNIKSLICTNKNYIEKKYVDLSKSKVKYFKDIKIVSTNNLNVHDIIKHKFLIFTKESIEDLISVLSKREGNYYRKHKKYKDIDTHKESIASKYKFDFNPENELVIQTPSLKGSLETILKNEFDPEGLKRSALKQYEDEKLLKNKIKERKRLELSKKAEERANLSFVRQEEHKRKKLRFAGKMKRKKAENLKNIKDKLAKRDKRENLLK